MKLIPAEIGLECKSNAERKVFKFLKESSLEGYAFHSVGLPKHEKKSYSEADFIIVTRNGILCLEVKGGQVSCENGLWAFEDRYNKKDFKTEGPFEQVAGARFALRQALKSTFPWIENISFASGVVFTDITFSYRGVSVIPEVMYDYSSKELFDDFIIKCHEYWDSREHRKLYYLNNGEIEQIKSAIRDDLHFVPSLQATIDSVDEYLIQLTDEQIDIIDSIADNDKIVVNGPAGSGKTIIALEYARHAARDNKRVLFLVYNKCLAQYISRIVSNEDITVKHIHGLITDYVAVDLQKAKTPQYFSEILPEKFEALLDAKKIALYDVLVIDEGQDLLTYRYVSIFNKLLKKGLYGGRWIMFYDGNQNLFVGSKFSKALDGIKKFNPMSFKLTKNCRNTQQIADFNKYCSRIDSGKTSICGEDVKVIGCAQNEECSALESLLDKLLSSGVVFSDIMIISPYTMENSKISNYDGKYKNDIVKFSGERIFGKIAFATIQSFKGLDSKIVIAMDMQNYLNDNNVIAYTLFSRARAMLCVILEDTFAENLIKKILTNKSVQAKLR